MTIPVAHFAVEDGTAGWLGIDVSVAVVCGRLT